MSLSYYWSIFLFLSFFYMKPQIDAMQATLDWEFYAAIGIATAALVWMAISVLGTLADTQPTRVQTRGKNVIVTLLSKLIFENQFLIRNDI